jgi:predicted ATPase
VLQALEASILSHEPVAGRRPEGGEGPSGPGAVLAMEVIAARKLWLERTSRMHHAYSALHQLVTGTVGRLGGSVTGDSGERITVAFDEPGAAIQAAVACQIATRSADFYVDLTVRAAVAGRAGAGQGAAAEQVVERCCQLAAYAPPGAVLVSDELVGAVGAAGFEVSGYGTIRSHGHLQRSRLHLVVADGLDAAGTLLPVAESLSLPRPVTTLVGRDREVSLVKRLVDEHHLVSIVGPAGVGKTALAIEVAWTVARDLDDGAFFVDLSPARPDSVASIVAAALGIRADDDSALTATLGAVAGRQMLLVLDNCEHDTDAVAELAGHCESLGVDLRMLATTRRAIDAGSERVYALRPLAVRQLGTTGQLAPAVQLFFDRAHQSGCELSEDELTVDRVARICDQLDGLPLAVELTAARLRSTSLRGIEEQLSTAGPLVTASSGNRQERDLERTIAWSYDLLPERERSTFSHLGVFHGSFGIDAAASVAGRSPESVVSMLRHLADWSLVMPVDNERETRYRTLETLRAFAASRLGGQGPSDNALRRHADYFRELARAGERELCGPHEARWVARFVDDFENLIGAFEWYVGTGEADDAIDLAGSLWSFALQRTEGARFFAAVESALSSPAMAGSARRSELLGIAANGAWLRGDPLTACDLAIASITAEDEPTRSAGSGRALIPARMALLNAVGSGFGSRDFRPQVHAEAAAAFDSMQEICHRAGDPYWLVFPYVLASFARSFVGDYGSAQSAASSAVEHAIVSGSVTALSWALLARASALHPADTRPAVDACERSLREASEIGSQFPAALAVSQLAILRRRAGDHATAAAHLVDGLERWHRLGNAPHAWHAIREACLLADAMGRTELIGPLLDALGAQSLVFPHDETDMRAARSLAKAAAPPRPGRPPETLDLRAALDLARTDLGQVRGVPAVG